MANKKTAIGKKQKRSHKGDPRISKVKLREYLNDIIGYGHSTLEVIEKTNTEVGLIKDKDEVIKVFYVTVAVCEAIKKRFCE